MYFGVFARQKMGPRQKWAFPKHFVPPAILSILGQIREGNKADIVEQYLIPKSGISGIRPVTRNGIKWAKSNPKKIRPTVFNKICMVMLLLPGQSGCPSLP